MSSSRPNFSNDHAFKGLASRVESAGRFFFPKIRHVEFFSVRGRLFDDFVWVHRRETFGFTLLVNPGVLLNVVSLFKSSTCRTSSDFSDQIFFVRILSLGCVIPLQGE